MVMCARILSGITPFVAAPLAVGAYAACLWGTGGVKGDDVAALGDVVARKLGQR
jgi:hypothetical protein